MLRLLGEGGLGQPYQYTSDQSHEGSPYRRSYLETFWVPDSRCPFVADFVEDAGFAQAFNLTKLAGATGDVASSVEAIQKGIAQLQGPPARIPQFKMEREEFDKVARDFADMPEAAAYREVYPGLLGLDPCRYGSDLPGQVEVGCIRPSRSADWRFWQRSRRRPACGP